MTKWLPLASGTYNTAYRSDDGLKVLKIRMRPPIGDEPDLDSPRRSIRIWNELNPELQPPAYVTQSKHGIGWVCPFVEGIQASDEEISAALIRIYNSSGRIVVDATAPKNFIKTPSGNVVCVDIGKALQMDRREESYFVQGSRRRKSITSLEEVVQKGWESDTWFFNANRQNYPKTVDMNKALIFIKSNRPNIFNVNFLNENPALINRLAKAYDGQEIFETLDLLDKEIVGQTKSHFISEDVIDSQNNLKTNIDNIKENCIKQLESYINIRGTLDRYGFFEPSFISKIFRNKMLLEHKALNACSLIKLINKADSLDSIEMILKEAQDDITLSKSKFTSGMAASLEKCMIIVSMAKQDLESVTSMSNWRY